MLNWMKNSVGLTEPIYGPSAIQSVADQAKTTPYTEITSKNIKWEVMNSTCVETKTFYMTTPDGRVGLCSLIYSNVLGIRTTAQFSVKIFSKDPAKPHHWSTDNISDFSFSENKQDFNGDGVSVRLSEDGKSFHIKSTLSKTSIVDLKFTQATPAFVAGKDGTTYFGTDPEKPWGRMRHAFWPRCTVEGTIVTKEGPVDFTGLGLFSHALMGMKPHFAAAKWNFADFQSPNYSAILMNFTTPASYGESSVIVGGITTKDGILIAGANPELSVTHTEIKGDPENGWPEPSAVNFTWKGKTSDGKEVTASLDGGTGRRFDRLDVMGEMPAFVKSIVAGASGAKPYIYQFCPEMTLKLDIGGEKVEEHGQLFMEATFIS